MSERPAPAEYVVGPAADMPPGEHKVVRIRNLEVGIYNIDGTYYALHSMCPHQFGPACMGNVTGQMINDAETGWRNRWTRDGEILVCPWHGMEFHVTTGKCLSSATYRLRTFPVRVVDGNICVQLGGRSAAQRANSPSSDAVGNST